MSTPDEDYEGRGRLMHVVSLTHRVSAMHTKYPMFFECERVERGQPDHWVKVHIRAQRPCNRTGELGWQEGRHWLIHAKHTDAQIFNTLLLAVLTFEEHEIREQFLVDGKPLYEPNH